MQTVNKDAQKFGALKVTAPYLTTNFHADVPFVVVDEMMNQVGQNTLIGRTLQLEAGKYAVIVTLPDGARFTKVVRISPGEQTSLQIDWKPDRFEKSARRPNLGFGLGSGSDAKDPYFFGLRFFLQEPETMIFHPADSCMNVKKVDEVRNDGALKSTWSLSASKHFEGVMFIQVVLPGRVPVVSALPVMSWGESSNCMLYITTGPEAAEFVIRFCGNERIQASEQYMASGEVELAKNLSASAEELLMAKIQDPVAAALGGYVLLRTGELKKLHNWPQNLAKWFDWLPDGAVISGEQQFRMGNIETAFQWFRTAAQRGLPLFADGYSLLTSNLLNFSRNESINDAPNPHINEAAKLLARFRPVAPFTDFRSYLTVFSAADPGNPAESQHPIPLGADIDENQWKLIYMK